MSSNSQCMSSSQSSRASGSTVCIEDATRRSLK
jgi:hypothetical protein